MITFFTLGYCQHISQAIEGGQEFNFLLQELKKNKHKEIESEEEEQQQNELNPKRKLEAIETTNGSGGYIDLIFFFSWWVVDLRCNFW